MTSRQSDKRTMRKCELSLETLHARIAPAGLHAGSMFLAGVHGHFEFQNQKHGKHEAPKDPGNAPIFLIQKLGKVEGNHGASLTTHPFLNLAVTKPKTIFTTSGTPTNNSTSGNTTPLQTWLIGPPKLVTVPTTNGTTTPAPPLQIRLIGPPKVITTTTTTTPTNPPTNPPAPLNIRMIESL
jgi:hypothetical protein